MDSNNLEEFRFIRLTKYFSSVWGALIGLSVLIPYFNEPWIPLGGMENSLLNGIIIVFLFVPIGFLLGYYLGGIGGKIFHGKNFGMEDIYGAAIIFTIILTITLLFIIWEIFYITGYSTGAIMPFNEPGLLLLIFFVFLYLILFGSGAGVLGGLIFGFLAKRHLFAQTEEST